MVSAISCHLYATDLEKKSSYTNDPRSFTSVLHLLADHINICFCQAVIESPMPSEKVIS